MALEKNEEIKNNKIRISNRDASKILSLSEALNLAKNEDLDLIKINENNNTAICIVEKAEKYIYKKKKKDKELKQKQKKTQKEIRFTLMTSEHDLEHKSKQVKDFVHHGNEVKITVIMRGRENNRPEEAKRKISNFIKLCGLSDKTNIRAEGKEVFALVN